MINRRFALLAALALTAMSGCASQSDQATVITGRGAPWQTANAYLQRVDTADGACYVLIRKEGDVALGVSCVAVPEAER